MNLQTKVKNIYDQSKSKFYKKMILDPYMPTGARQLTKGGENYVKNNNSMENF